jgi:hypothetical protein
VKLLAGSGVENALAGGEGGQPPTGPVEATLLTVKQKLIVVQHTHDLRGTFDGHADGTGASISKKACIGIGHSSCARRDIERSALHGLQRTESTFQQFSKVQGAVDST